MSDELDLAAIEARCERATKGPWYPRATDDSHFMNARYVSTEQGPMVMFKGKPVWEHDGLRGMADGECDYKSVVCITLLQEPRLVAHASDACDEDAEFIAHAREDIPALLAEVKRLTALHMHGCDCAPDDACEFARQRDSALAGIARLEAENERLQPDAALGRLVREVLPKQRVTLGFDAVGLLYSPYMKMWLVAPCSSEDIEGNLMELAAWNEPEEALRKAAE